MPQREEQDTECAHCGCMHKPSEMCEGLMPYRQEDITEVPQVDSPYLRKAMEAFKKKRKKKEDK